MTIYDVAIIPFIVGVVELLKEFVFFFQAEDGIRD